MKRAPTPPAVTLSAEELRIILYFRSMEGRWQELALVRMARHARDYPRHSKPVLSLIAGGVK